MSEHFVLESIVTILVVIIPTIIGAFTSKFIINKWQEKNEEFQLKKEKSELRKKILLEKDDSIVARFFVCHGFVSHMNEGYMKNYRFESQEKTSVKYDIEFSNQNKDLPYIKFKDDVGSFRIKYNDLSKKVWDFFSTLTVYYDNKEIKDLIFKIFEEQSNINDSIHVLSYSKTADEYVSRLNHIIALSDVNRQSMSDLTRLMVTTPLKNIPD